MHARSVVSTVFLILAAVAMSSVAEATTAADSFQTAYWPTNGYNQLTAAARACADRDHATLENVKLSGPLGYFNGNTHPFLALAWPSNSPVTVIDTDPNSSSIFSGTRVHLRMNSEYLTTNRRLWSTNLSYSKSWPIESSVSKQSRPSEPSQLKDPSRVD